MHDFTFNLGDEVKDKITGYKGVIRARSQYLTGCNTYGIQSQKLTKEEAPQDWKWFDEDQLSLLTTQKVTFRKEVRRTGGPQSTDQYPSRR